LKRFVEIIKNNEDCLIVFFALIIFYAYTLTLYPTISTTGSDEQWLNLTNSLFNGNQDILFSQGPLLWVIAKVSEHYDYVSFVICSVFLTIVLSIIWVLILKLVTEIKFLIIIAVLFFLFCRGNVSFLVFNSLLLFPIFIIFLLEKYQTLSQKTLFKVSIIFVFFGIITAFVIYIRYLFGFMFAGVFLSYLFIKLFSDFKKSFMCGLSFCITFIMVYFIFGYLIFHNISSIYEYLIINYSLSSANSTEMCYDLTLPFIIYTIIIINLFIGIFFVNNKNLLLTILFFNLVTFKLGYSRADHYFPYYLLPVVLLNLTLIFYSRMRFRYILAIFQIFIMYLLVFSMPHKFVNLTPPIFKLKKNFNSSYTERMAQKYHPFKLNTIPAIIKNNSVDVYPEHNEFIFANKLNYLHRPIFQEYMTLTPYLDKLNAEFYSNSNTAPKYILWTGNGSGRSLSGIDGKYILNEDPLTTLSIISNYHMIEDEISSYKDVKVLLLKRNSENNMEFQNINTPNVIKRENIFFNKWYKVPSHDNNFLLKLKTHFDFTFIGKIKNLLYHGPVVYIIYKLNDGRELKYRLNILNSSNGIWLEPFYTQLHDRANSVKEFYFKYNGYLLNEMFNVDIIQYNNVTIKILKESGLQSALPDLPFNQLVSYAFTDENWLNGIYRGNKGGFLNYDPVVKPYLQPGVELQFSKSDYRVIERVNNEQIWVKGSKLDPKGDGNPNIISIISLKPEVININKVISAFKPVFCIDSIKSGKLVGWSYHQNINSNNITTFILLKNKDDIIYKIPTIKESRPDVSNAFNVKDEYDNAGFNINLNDFKLKKGKYQIGLYLKFNKQIGYCWSNKYYFVK